MNRNAIIMAAGLSTRFVPLSLEVPKALLKVKGEVLIERQIRQLKEAGIQEIIIVVGYQKEKFLYLEEEFSVKVIENPVYKVRNNHSTLFVAKEYLKNTFICSGDNYFTENVFAEEVDKSYYASVFEAGRTNEWCMNTAEDGRIKEVTIGGGDAWVMKGHAYFTEEFSKQMIPYLETAYTDEGKKNQFWEEIFMEHMDEMDMYIHKYEQGIIEEFDSIEELRSFDKTYEISSGSKIMKRLSEMFRCEEKDFYQITPIKTEGEVSGFYFCFKNKKYEYSLNHGNVVSQEEEYE